MNLRALYIQEHTSLFRVMFYVVMQVHEQHQHKPYTYSIGLVYVSLQRAKTHHHTNEDITIIKGPKITTRG